ncbi:MAG: methyltransferase, partial [Gammaproteobacteria bacterium]
WRLPPTLHLNDSNEAKRAEYEKIGESDRMTLLFRKR